MQIWSVLTFAARNRQIVTYSLLAKLIGVPTAALGQLLDPIHAYCSEQGHPALTAIVVSEETGRPGEAFSGVEDVPASQMAVFRKDWTLMQPPTPTDFVAAIQRRRS